MPNAGGRVLSETGEPLPGEYVAGWLKRGPTGVIGTNKADAAETVQALLADLAGGPAPGETALPRPGLLRMPGSANAAAPAPPPAAAERPAGAAPADAAAADLADAAVDTAVGLADAAAAAGDAAGAEAAAEVASEAWALAELLAARGVDHVTYEAWLRVSAAEEELARSLGRGDRVKLPHRDAVWSAARG